MRICKKCGEAKPLEQYSRSKLGRDGLQGSCKECVSDYFAAYYAENPHKNWEGYYRRRARALGFAPMVESFTEAEMIAHWVNGRRCIYCDGPFQEIEHLIPIGLGGAHTLDNCAPSCRPCNRVTISSVRAARAELAA